MGWKTRIEYFDVTRCTSGASLVMGDNATTNRSKLKRNYGLDLTINGRAVAPAEEVKKEDTDAVDLAIHSMDNWVGLTY